LLSSCMNPIVAATPIRSCEEPSSILASLKTMSDENEVSIEDPWRLTKHVKSDDVSTSLGDGSDTPRSQDSTRSWGCNSLVELCSLCPVPAVAKAGVLEIKRTFPFTRSSKRFLVVRYGFLEVWLNEKKYANDSSKEEIVSLRDLKDMDQHRNSIILKFLQHASRIGRGMRREKILQLRADSESDAIEWFVAIEYVLKSMSMPIDYSLCEMPVFQSSILQDFQRLINHCFFPKNTRDRRGQILPKGLKVMKVVRVQNSTLHRMNSDMHRQMQEQLKDSDRQQAYDILSPDVRTSLLDPPLPTLPQLNDDTIERWLFHGTTIRSLNSIAESNFDLSRAGSGAGTMYGEGIYCADCCSK